MKKERPGKGVSRRRFIRQLLGAGSATVLASCSGRSDTLLDLLGGDGGELPFDGAPDFMRRRPPQGPVIFLAVDSLHPAYLELDSSGMPGGQPGNWLMPRCREFLAQATWFKNAQTWLPTATDMNHLNAISATHCGQTGIISVFGQLTGWETDGSPRISPVHLDLAKDDQGRKVDTLFHAFKRHFPDRRTAYISGKGWVADMFRTKDNLVDVIINGQTPFPGISPPTAPNLSDPPSDTDGPCDPESAFQTGVVATQMEKYPDVFPSDEWIVDRALEVFAEDPPAFTYIILSQLDDAGHALGAGHDPTEFVKVDPAFEVEGGCQNKDGYQWVSSRNPRLYREPILDSVREADGQVGRFLDGLAAMGLAEDATIVLFSDHNMENHIIDPKWLPGYCDLTDFMGMLRTEGLAGDDDAITLCASTIANTYWRDGKERVAKARKLLLDYQAKNPVTGVLECPWLVLDRNDMKAGVTGVCLPGELYHPYFIETTGETEMVWPDLIMLARNGWQMPVYLDSLPAFPIPIPFTGERIAPFIGGHGAVDTGQIVMGVKLPGGSPGTDLTPFRISDMAATLASIMGFTFKSTTIGVDRSSLLG
jgi:hypothetical protein